MSYGISITTSTIQRAILCSAAISVVLTSSLASFAAKIVRSHPRTHQVSAMDCISVQGAMQKDVPVVVGGSWNLCNAFPCKSYLLIITGLCVHSEVLALRYFVKSKISESYLSFHYVYAPTQ